MYFDRMQRNFDLQMRMQASSDIGANTERKSLHQLMDDTSVGITDADRKFN